LLLLVAAPAFAQEQQTPRPLLRDGFVMMGADGKVVARADKWFFEIERDISDGRTVIAAGSKLQILPSSGLEKLVADMAENNRNTYRLYNALVTRYDGQNYLFCDYFVPLAEVSEPAPEQSGEPNETPTEIRINEPNDAVTIPQEIIEKLRGRRIIRPEKLKKGLELKQDSILTGRTGFIKKNSDGAWVFDFDAVGRNVSKVSLELLPCRMLDITQQKQTQAPGRVRFEVSGIVTKYHGKYYLLLQTAKRSYGHGNFGR
jgi:hypothetical protein